MKLHRSPVALLLLFALHCSVVAQVNPSITEQNIRAELSFLASDAMQGRGSGTIYERIAAEYIGSQFRQFGLEPGGDTDSAGNKVYVQRVPLDDANATWNAVGILRGSDPQASSETIMLSAHLDHLGVKEALNGDKIFNGADDDASGCVAVMELARVLASGKRPRRTIYFVCFGSEERGGLGSQYFIEHSPVPLTQIVADITFEMLGRPDAKVPAGTLWLTGFERSTLGPELAKQGASLVADPHPEQSFFQRSDNYPLALRGVIAHTISSFGLHSDYHRPSDEVSKIDFPFMTRSLNSLVKPIEWLANSTFRPAWLPGKAPTR
ncbi:MAG TPA: M20/M25/M40 family metallo-hydrolase [Pyrinomonadaceae bacterium]|nr:M20/M25/M40 family metallo-hydrolase [Pyrinomonadaceae bacterium]